MTQTTITEALAEIRTVEKRVAKVQQNINLYLFRQEPLRDPHEKEGGSFEFMRREMQSYNDLCQRLVDLRGAIRRANDNTEIAVAGETRTVADWMVWRRDVAPRLQQLYGGMRNGIEQARKSIVSKGGQVTADPAAARTGDLIVNISEGNLAHLIEHIEIVLGELDGALSLRNALTTIEVPD